MQAAGGDPECDANRHALRRRQALQSVEDGAADLMDGGVTRAVEFQLPGRVQLALFSGVGFCKTASTSIVIFA